MARRLFEIAKDLGIESKAIVAKCQAEGISEATVKNHMSTISAGLEATIREWFSGGGGTAVETTEKVDVERVRSKSARSRKSKKDGEADSSTDTGHEHAPATAGDSHADDARDDHHDHQAPHAPQSVPTNTPVHTGAAPQAHPHSSTHPQTATHAPSADLGEGDHKLAVKIPHSKSSDEKSHAAEGDHHEPRAGETRGHSRGDAPHAHPHTPADAGAATHHAAPTRVVITPADPAKAEPPADHARSGSAAAASAPGRPGSAGPDDHGTHRPSGPGHVRPSGPVGGPVKVAPMNVPSRPTTVSPAGPKLATPTAVRLSGPKVVRVEAPDVVDTPRPRGPRPPMGGGGMTQNRGPRQGTGAGGGESDDGGRSPRRRGGGGGAPASGGAGAGTKRSSGVGVPARRRASSGQEWVGNTQKIFSEQDLIERDARLMRSGGFLKRRRADLNKRQDGTIDTGGPQEGRVRIAAPFTIKDLSEVTGVKAAEIVKKLFLQGVMATINSGIDPLKAQEIMIDFDIDLDVVESKSVEEEISFAAESRVRLDERARGPVVTILGHVDHGKTSLLDRIRHANVAAGEAGGITQRTSAFKVPIEIEGEQKEVVFLDTPGHEAFTSMRSRGANMTDVVVLVVSAPEGVMPQTIESINHAKAAEVPIVVALNKIDRPDATEQQVQKVLGRLAENGLNPVEWGGDIEVVKTSATTGAGITELLAVLDYQAQLLALKADFGGPAQGTVIEAKMEEGRGAVANILIQEGQLKVGDFVVMGRGFGKVRDISDDRGQKLKAAFPPSPVQISGIDLCPEAGDSFYVVDSLKQAQEAAETRRHREREQQLAQPKVTLDSMFANLADKDVKEIRVVLKVAEQGTLDVLKAQCEKIGSAEVKVRVLEAAIGGITESNVLLAQASQAIIIGFNVIPSGKARSLADQKGVEIRTYEVIYDITDDLKKAAEGLLAPELRQEILGHAEVRQVFTVSKVGKVAGCYVTDGLVQRDALIRVTRNGIVIENGRKLEQLKRVKDDAKEVRTGMECGMKIVGYDDIKEGDILECYKQIEVKRTL